MNPLQEPASLVLRSSLEAAGVARRFAVDAVGDLLDAERRAHLELLISELVTNSVIHAGSVIMVMLCRDGERVRVDVDDQSTNGPMRRTTTGGDGGWGLQIVDRVAQAWGVERRTHGKRVWFLI